MLAQVSTAVFTTGLPGRPPITQFPALPAEQDTVCRARHTAHRKTRSSGWPGHDSPTGRHEKLPAAQAGHDSGMRSHVCQGDTRHFRTFVRCHTHQSRPQFVRLRTIYDRTVGGARATEAEHGSRIWIYSVAMIVSFVREFYAFLYAEKKRPDQSSS
jgi:hypothetical protein